MGETIKHECGIALVRLRKPFQYYIDKYGTPLYGLNKLYVLMEKQKNRGQDGAGVVALRMDVPAGQKYFNRIRSTDEDALSGIFKHIQQKFADVSDPEQLRDGQWLKDNVAYTGELLLGHLRYGTHGENTVEKCHPFLRQNNWMTRNLIMAGNFNLTNTPELFDQLVEIGQHPKEQSDTVTVLEKIGHFLDEEIQRLFRKYKKKGLGRKEITYKIIQKLEPQKFLRKAAADFDGGYVMVGLIGHGDSFVMRDPSGIRPAYYYVDDEVVIAASERPAIQTAMGASLDQITELQPGNALIIKKEGLVEERRIQEPLEKKACSFERIYFSRGNDADIYSERKQLGFLMAPTVLEAIDYKVDEAVFSFIPNTAETAFYGLVKGLEEHLNKSKLEKLAANSDPKEIQKILDQKIRIEKVAIKDAKLRTFITQDENRNELVSHVYDVTYGIVKKGIDTLVVIDDSIVRGTTLKQSIIANLDRLGPKKIIVLSTAPQIRYPDCYGIDMSKMGNFVAFRAIMELLNESGQSNIAQEVYKACVEENEKANPENMVKRLYESFAYEAVSDKIAQLVTNDSIKAEVSVIYQTIDRLHLACPNHKGDWYFSGNYPTAGGNRVSNRAFINFMEGRVNARAY